MGSANIWAGTDVDELLVATAGVVAALTAIGTVIYRFVIRPMRDAVEEVAEMGRWVREQMEPNGGDSLRDKINSLTTELAEIKALLAVVPELAQRITFIETEIRSLKEHQP